MLAAVSGSGFAVEWKGSYDEGLSALLTGAYDVCLIDYRLIGERTGLDLLRQAKREGVRAPLILLTGLWDSAIDLEAMRSGAADYLVKGQFGPDLLERSLRYAVERSIAVEALRDSEERYRALVEGSRALLFSLKPNGRLEHLNDGARAALGPAAEEFLGRHVLRLVHAKDRPAVSQALRVLAAGGPPQQVQFRLASVAPREHWWFAVLLQMSTRGRQAIAGVAQDVTRQRELEEMYVQSEKMSAMGFLAAGIAHELNTPLSIILGSLERLEGGGARSGKSEVRDAQRAAERCRQLVEQMLDFSRKDAVQPERFNLCDAVKAAVSLVEPQTRLRSLELVFEPAARGVFISGHRTQIEQVVVNLANNAIDAMSEGGRLEVRADRLRREGRPFARIEVIDTGRGIPAELLDKVVEPFFTTKPQGKGTGLGLSLASSIVANHGGALEIASKPKRGTTVTVLLPMAEAR